MGPGKRSHNIYPQIPRHSVHPRHPPVPLRPSRHLGGVRPHTESDPQDPGGHLRPPFHFLTPYKINLRAGPPPPQHNEIPGWLQLGSAKGNPHNNVQGTNQTHSDVCSPILVPQRLSLLNRHSPNHPKLSTTDSHRIPQSGIGLPPAQ